MRRGFALAFVIILAAIVVIMSGVMIQRHGAARLNVERDIAAYQAHHAGRGLTEVAWAWVQSIPSDGVRKIISKEGHAFDLHLGDGTTITVTLRDAQGTVLADPAAMTGRDRDKMADILGYLREIMVSEIPEGYLRQVGPVKVSALTAPPEVLEALGRHVTDGEDVSGFVTNILKARQDDDFRDIHVTQAMTKAGLSAQANAKLRGLLTAEPTLWIVRAEITPKGSREPTDAYEGIAEIDTRGNRRGGSSGFSPWGPFLSWERVDVNPVGLGAGGRP